MLIHVLTMFLVGLSSVLVFAWSLPHCGILKEAPVPDELKIQTIYPILNSLRTILNT
jgi:hypothetical protein